MQTLLDRWTRVHYPWLQEAAHTTVSCIIFFLAFLMKLITHFINHEHLLNQIREQADQIQKLMTKLEEVSKRPAPLNTSTSDVFNSLPSPVFSTTTTLGPTFSDRLSEAPDGGPGPETDRAVEDWIARAKGSLADFIGIAGSGIQDPEDDPSSEDDENDSGEATNNQNAEFEIVVETDELGEEEERSHQVARRSVRKSSNSSVTVEVVAPLGVPGQQLDIFSRKEGGVGGAAAGGRPTSESLHEFGLGPPRLRFDSAIGSNSSTTGTRARMKSQREALGLSENTTSTSTLMENVFLYAHKLCEEGK
jgi:hypothetical protein